MRRELGQLSLADGLVDSGAGVTGSWSGSRRWSTGRASSGCSARSMRRRSGGRRTGRCSCSSASCCSSDTGCPTRAFEEALADRLSLRRFVGLALADRVPDHSTRSRFRGELTRRGLAERLLAELNRQLDARGLMVKGGTLIDANSARSPAPPGTCRRRAIHVRAHAARARRFLAAERTRARRCRMHRRQQGSEWAAPLTGGRRLASLTVRGHRA
jgi:transposase, IS5 family